MNSINEIKNAINLIDAKNESCTSFFAALGMKRISRIKSVVVRQTTENKRGAKYDYLVFSFSKEFIDRAEISDTFNLWINENGVCGFSKGENCKLSKSGNRYTFKIAKEKVCAKDSMKLTLHVPNGLNFDKYDIEISSPKK